METETDLILSEAKKLLKEIQRLKNENDMLKTQCAALRNELNSYEIIHIPVSPTKSIKPDKSLVFVQHDTDEDEGEIVIQCDYQSIL